jgi:hypothetical protein
MMLGVFLSVSIMLAPFVQPGAPFAGEIIFMENWASALPETLETLRLLLILVRPNPYLLATVIPAL